MCIRDSNTTNKSSKVDDILDYMSKRMGNFKNNFGFSASHPETYNDKYLDKIDGDEQSNQDMNDNKKDEEEVDQIIGRKKDEISRKLNFDEY